MFQSRFLDAAYAVALTSNGVGGKTKHNFRLGSVLVRKNKIIAAKPNSYKSNPKLLKWYPWPCLHAEAAVILAAGLDNCYKADIYVARAKRDGSRALARPCSSCVKLMQEVGIRNYYYTE